MHGGRGKKEVQVGLLNLFLDIFVSFGMHLNRVHGGRGKKEVQVGRRNLFLALFFVQEVGRLISNSLYIILFFKAFNGLVPAAPKTQKNGK